MTATHADLVLLSDQVFWMTPGEPVSDGFVAVTDGRITATGPRADAPAHIGPGTDVVDVGHRPLLPGFVDVHAHMEVAARTACQTSDVRVPGCTGVAYVIITLRTALPQADDGWLVA